MVLLIWARFDWSWLSSFTSEALAGKLRWFHCSPHRTSSSTWLSRPIPIRTGSVPKERVEAHKVSWVQALNLHTVTQHILFAKGSHKPGPRSIWRNGLCLFIGKDTKSPMAKGREVKNDCYFCHRNQIPFTQKKVFLCWEFNLDRGELFITPKGLHKSKHVNQVEPGFQFTQIPSLLLTSAATHCHSHHTVSQFTPRKESGGQCLLKTNLGSLWSGMHPLNWKIQELQK